MRGDTEITNSADILDSRDIIDRIAFLEDETGTDPEFVAELKALKDLQEEASGYSEDWLHGSTLIRDSYFKEYAQQLAEDVGAIKGDEGWPLTCIDWEEAASELQVDYTQVDFDGIEYWVR